MKKYVFIGMMLVGVLALFSFTLEKSVKVGKAVSFNLEKVVLDGGKDAHSHWTTTPCTCPDGTASTNCNRWVFDPYFHLPVCVFTGSCLCEGIIIIKP